MIAAAAWLALLVPAAPARSSSLSRARTANTADLAGRCAAADQPEPGDDKGLYDRQLREEGPLEGAITAVLTQQDPKGSGWSTWFARQTDYYAHRAEVRGRIEKRFEALRGEDRARALDDYAALLEYLGEYRAVVELFGPGGRLAEETQERGNVRFAVGQSLLRLGRFREAAAAARAARRLLPGADFDTLWQLMLAELGELGPRFYARHGKDYTAAHVEELFPNKSLASFPFEDASDRLGAGGWAGTGSLAFADLDGDGWDELLVLRKFLPGLIYQNDHGRLSPKPDPFGTRMCSANIQTLADIDNDGRPDIRRTCCNVRGSGPGLLLRNAGSLRFEDVTARSGLDGERKWTLEAWADFDLDGHVDYAVGDLAGNLRLFHNNGDGTFTDWTRKSGIVTPGSSRPGEFGTSAAAWGDYDGDGLPDLLAVGWGWRRLFHNNGDGTFTDVTERSGLGAKPGDLAYNAFFVDYDNDGKLDIFVGQYVDTSGRVRPVPTCTCSNLLKPGGYSSREWASASTIFRNNGDGTFTNMVDKTHFMPLGVMGANHADWNNDGYEDLVLGTGGPSMQQIEPLLFYQNNGDGTFTNITPFTALTLWGKGHGSAFGDYDHDGQVDLVHNLGGPAPGDEFGTVLLHNKGSSNHWLEVQLAPAPGTNGLAIGASVRAKAGTLEQRRVLEAGVGFNAQNSFMLHLGLGAHDKVDELVVEWPNQARRRTTLRDVPADRAIRVSESDGSWTTLWTAPAKARANAKSKAKTARKVP